jgi:hypothetical protein
MGTERRERRPEPAAFPSREELIAWGMVPCSNPDCRMLVNAELIRVCTRCATNHGLTDG